MTEKLALRHPEKAHRPDNPVLRKPDWIRVKAPTSAEYAETKALVRKYNLHTVCEEAACPNIGECWQQKHATFMILGSVCTRGCAFCNVATGRPDQLDPHEPDHVAEACAQLGLKHVVVTSVDRDDLDDGGAGHFAQVIRRIRAVSPGTTIEVLTPDFLNKPGAIAKVVEARPDVFNHNLETVPRLYRSVRPGRALFHLAAPAAEREGDRPADVHQVGHDGRPRRRERRSVPGDGRPARRRCRFPHHRPVPAADQEASRGGALRPAGRVRDVQAAGGGQGLPAGRGLAADPLLAPCRR